jgi:WD40 repeat protein
MAPEQASGGRRRPVGPAADVYALGAVLYELLTGRPPFTGETPLDVLLQVLHDEPVSVMRLRPTVPRDLATIAHKCLAKEPGKRYQSALELAEDLRRFQEGQPIKARPVGALERLGKWARRRPAVAGLLVAFLLAIGGGLGLAGWQWRKAEQNADEAIARRKDAQEEAAAKSQALRETERLLISAEIDKATTLCERGDMTWGVLLLAQNLQRASRVGDADLERVIRTGLATWRRVFVVPQAALPHTDWIWDVAFSPDGRTVVTGSKDRTAQLWDAVTGERRGPALQHDFPVWTVAFSPDGRTVLTGCGTNDGRQGEARLWDAATGQRLGPALATEGTVGYASFNADGTRILTLSRDRAHLWKIAEGTGTKQPAAFDLKSAIALPHPGLVLVARFSPDGRTVVTGGTDRSARLWNAATGKIVGKMLDHPGPVQTVAFRPDGRTLATGTMLPDAKKQFYVGGAVRLWDAARCIALGKVMPHAGPLKAMTFSSDGRTLLTGCVVVVQADARAGADPEYRGEIRLWDTETTELLGPPPGAGKAGLGGGVQPRWPNVPDRLRRRPCPALADGHAHSH